MSSEIRKALSFFSTTSTSSRSSSLFASEKNDYFLFLLFSEKHKQTTQKVLEVHFFKKKLKKGTFTSFKSTNRQTQ